MSLLRLPSGEYRLTENGVPCVVPGVTRVLSLLRPYANVRGDTLISAQRRGQAAHRAIHLLEGGGDGSGLEWASVDPRILPYVQAWEKFKAETKWRTILTEVPMASARFRYGCTPDLLGEINARLIVLDIKSGQGPLVALQTAAQAQAINETKRLHGKPKRYSLFLTSRGTSRLHEHADPADFPTFTALLQIYQWLARFQPKLIPEEIEADYANFEEVLGG